MANTLSKDQQLQILRLLVEGNSLRAITRTTGVHRTTIQNLLYRFGNRVTRILLTTPIEPIQAAIIEYGAAAQSVRAGDS